MGGPHSECLRVSLQAFGIGQRNPRRRDSTDSLAGHLLTGNHADEIEHTETAPHASHPTRGQHMVWSGDVIACGLRRELIQENRACVLYCRRQRRREREMFGRDAIRRLDSLVKRRDHTDGAATRERLGGDRICTRTLPHLLLNSYR